MIIALCIVVEVHEVYQWVTLNNWNITIIVHDHWKNELET